MEEITHCSPSAFGPVQRGCRRGSDCRERQWHDRVARYVSFLIGVEFNSKIKNSLFRLWNLITNYILYFHVLTQFIVYL